LGSVSSFNLEGGFQAGADVFFHKSGDSLCTDCSDPKNDVEQRRGVGFGLNFHLSLSGEVLQMAGSQDPQDHLSLRMMCLVQNANFFWMYYSWLMSICNI
jgi:hypothetical protein